MAPGWEHERDDRTEAIPAFAQLIQSPDRPAPLAGQFTIRTDRHRSIFWPVYFGVLLALITFTFLLVLAVSWLAGHQSEELRLTYRLDTPSCASSLPLS